MITVDARVCGAVGDGKTDDTAAMQKALAGGDRLVTIPAGTYRIHDALQVESGTTIRADANAIIRLADRAGTHRGVFLLTNRDPVGGNERITIEGGIWDGNNQGNTRGEETDTNAYTGVAMSFINVRQFALRDLIIRNPDSYHFRACRLRDFVIENIGFDDSSLRPNQDGIHLNGFCERGVIRNLRALSDQATNDDMVALNADDGKFDSFPPNFDMEAGPIRDITVETLRAKSAYTFVRMLSHTSRIENVTVRDIVGGCRVNVLNMDRWQFPKGGGNIHNVTLRDFDVHRASDAPTNNAINIPLFTAQVQVHGLRLENIQRTAGDDSVSPTFMVGDRRPLHLEVAGLSESQRAGILRASPEIFPDMFTGTTAPDGTKTYRLIQPDQTGLVTLPAGGFALLTMESVTP